MLLLLQQVMIVRVVMGLRDWFKATLDGDVGVIGGGREDGGIK